MSGGCLAVPLLLLAFAGSSAAGAEEPPSGNPRSERLHYRWRLEGLSGFVSRLLGLLPTTGDALMELRRRSDDRLEVLFKATSEKAGKDDYWSYETEVDLGNWHSVSVVETLHYKQKRKRKSFELTELEVIDVLSGLQQLRYSQPGGVDRRTIWSDGKVYPVAVSSSGLVRRQFDGDELMVRHLSIRGIKEPKQHLWKARAEIWVTDDGAALPLEILYHQSLGRLRMTLVESPEGG